VRCRRIVASTIAVQVYIWSQHAFGSALFIWFQKALVPSIQMLSASFWALSVHLVSNRVCPKYSDGLHAFGSQVLIWSRIAVVSSIHMVSNRVFSSIRMVSASFWKSYIHMISNIMCFKCPYGLSMLLCLKVFLLKGMRCYIHVYIYIDRDRYIYIYIYIYMCIYIHINIIQTLIMILGLC
jgi:hypothetical protein